MSWLITTIFSRSPVLVSSPGSWNPFLRMWRYMREADTLSKRWRQILMLSHHTQRYASKWLAVIILLDASICRLLHCEKQFSLFLFLFSQNDNLCPMTAISNSLTPFRLYATFIRKLNSKKRWRLSLSYGLSFSICITGQLKLFTVNLIWGGCFYKNLYDR